MWSLLPNIFSLLVLAFSGSYLLVRLNSLMSTLRRCGNGTTNAAKSASTSDKTSQISKQSTRYSNNGSSSRGSKHRVRINDFS